jgi:hypothetical protein
MADEPRWCRAIFEFPVGYRRFAVGTGPGRGFTSDTSGRRRPALASGFAASLLQQHLNRDRSLRQRLAGWYRRTNFALGPGDDDRVISTLLRDIETGWMHLVELEAAPRPTYIHTYERPSPPPEPPPEPPPNIFEPELDEPSDEKIIEYLAVGDINFSTMRAVMLPGPSSEGEREGDHVDGVALIAGLLRHLQQLDDERRVLVAGHTDAAGSLAYNIELSKRRAQSVHLVCRGDAEGFADHAMAHAAVADGQEVLRWTAQRFGWSCDPGAVDDRDGPKTGAARQHFRDRFAAEFDAAAGTGAGFTRADWLGFFRLYEQDLAARLGVTPSCLPKLRARVISTDPPVLGCGEHWPEDTVARSRVNRADRRVELLCFPPADVPSSIADTTPPGASIYGASEYRWRPIAAGPGPHPLGGPCFEVSLSSEDLDGLEDTAVLRLRGGPYDLRHALADAHDRGLCRVFHFDGVAKGTAYTATIEHDDAEPIVLFSGASLDSYIAGIGDLDQQPEPLAIHLERGPEVWEPDGPYELSDPPDNWNGIYVEDW